MKPVEKTSLTLDEFLIKSTYTTDFIIEVGKTEQIIFSIRGLKYSEYLRSVEIEDERSRDMFIIRTCVVDPHISVEDYLSLSAGVIIALGKKVTDLTFLPEMLSKV